MFSSRGPVWFPDPRHERRKGPRLPQPRGSPQGRWTRFRTRDDKSSPSRLDGGAGVERHFTLFKSLSCARTSLTLSRVVSPQIPLHPRLLRHPPPTWREPTGAPSRTTPVSRRPSQSSRPEGGLGEEERDRGDKKTHRCVSRFSTERTRGTSTPGRYVSPTPDAVSGAPSESSPPVSRWVS